MPAGASPRESKKAKEIWVKVKKVVVIISGS
jgi:hypothetical protein